MDTFYLQQWRKLAKVKTKVNPRAQFWEDLTSFITAATADQAEVLLMLDANADINDLEISSFLEECGLQDLLDNCDIVPPPETYYRGKRKIDFCLGTPGVVNAVTQAGITPCEDGLKYSDH
jgi:exonuclease III